MLAYGLQQTDTALASMIKALKDQDLYDSTLFVVTAKHGQSPINPRLRLDEVVKRYGYTKKKKIKLYGKQLELVSDPVNREDGDVFVAAREEGTDQVREVQVP